MTREAAPATDPLIGRQIAKCQVLERIGQGGMGVVYKARHRTLGRLRALKLLTIGSGLTQAQIEQFFNEARHQSGIEHPNVVLVLDADRFENWFYILMQFVDGPSLGDVIRKTGPLAWPTAARVGIGTMKGLHAAHTADPPLVHRDIKPSNILLAPGWVPRVLDFGLVAEVDSDDPQPLGMAGTPRYVAPEQLKGAAATPLSDLYSFGVTLWETLAGRRLWTGDGLAAVARARLAAPAPRLDGVREGLPVALVELVADLLEREPDARPADASAVAARLAGILVEAPSRHDPPLPAAGPAPPTRDGEPLRKRPVRDQLARWAREGRVLYRCRKCQVYFLRGTHVDGQLVPCPACHARLTLPDRDSLALYHAAETDESLDEDVVAEPPPPVAADAISDDSAVEMADALLADPLEGLHLPPAFVGRDTLVSRIGAALEADERVVLIEGQRGLGKSRLLAELGPALGGRTRLRAAADGPSGPRPPFDRIARAALGRVADQTPEQLTTLAAEHGRWLVALVGEIGDLPEFAHVRPPSVDYAESRADALAALLTAASRSGPLALVIDDLDRQPLTADPLWDTVAAALVAHDGALVATLRQPLPADIAGSLAPAGVSHQTLTPLGDGVLSPLFSSVFGAARYPSDLIARLNYVALGVPADLTAALVEAVQAGQLRQTEDGWRWSDAVRDGEPLRLPASIDARLEAAALELPAGHREVLAVLARIGASITPAPLVEAGGFAADKLPVLLNDLAKRRILRRRSDGSFAFVSGRLGERLAQAVPADERPSLHARIAKILAPPAEATLAPARAQLVARHWQEAGDLEQSAAFELAAARGFASAAAPEPARAAYTRLLALLPELPARGGSTRLFRKRRRPFPDALELQCELAELAARDDAGEDALSQMSQGLTSAHGKGDAALVGRFERALALARAGRSEHAAALKHFGRIEDRSELADAYLLTRIARLLLMRDQHARVRELLDRARALSDSPPEDAAAVQLIGAQLALRIGRTEEVGERVQQALVAPPDGPAGEAMRGRLLAVAARALCRQGRVAAGNDRLKAARRRRPDDVQAEREVALAMTELLIASGRLDQAARTAHTVGRRAARTRRPWEQACALVLEAQASRSRPKAAHQLLNDALGLFEDLGAPYGRTWTYLALAELFLDTGQPADRTRSHLEFAARHLQTSGLEWPGGQLALLEARLAHGSGDGRAAAAALERARELADRHDLGPLRIAIDRFA